MMKYSWLLIVLLLTACSATKAEETAVQKQVTVGFLMDTLNEERWVKDRAYFTEEVQKQGANIQVAVAHGNDALQIEQAEKMIRSHVDILVIVPHNAQAMAAIVHQAHKANIQVISYDRIVKNADIDLYISFDNERVGQLQAEELLKSVPQGNVVYIGGASTDHNSHLLKKGAMNVLAPLIRSGDIRIQYDQWTKNWQPKEAAKGMEEALRINHHQIDAVIAANDATAYAAMQVIKQQRMVKKIAVIGQDADGVNIQAIQQGTQLATVYKPVKKLSSVAAKTAVSMAKKQKVDITDSIDNGKNNIPSILLEPILVTKKNIQNTVVKDGFYQEDK